MSSFRVSFHTLGCKLNQSETEAIAQAFAAEGFPTTPWGEPAEILIVNTCTVTSKAEQKARRLMRKALKEMPGACLIATGCYAQLDPESLSAVADRLDADDGAENRAGSASGVPCRPALSDRRRLVVVRGDDKAALLDLPAYLAGAACASSELPAVLAAWAAGERAPAVAEPASDGPIAVPSHPDEPILSDGPILSDRFRFDAAVFSFHSRASLKIQDGCDNLCSYCRVRLARGRSVSLDSSEAVRRLRQLEAGGYAEAVLTGINVSRYRDPGPDGLELPGLLGRMLAATDRIALRISSTEPDGADAEFAAAAAPPRVRPHFHLSVQSGSDAVLARMRRRYRAEAVEAAAARLRAAKGDPYLACDIIAGFPGETDADFEASYELCRRVGFAWIHAFPFSARPGTEAAKMGGRVPERIAAERVERLAALAAANHAAYAARWLGAEVEAVAEGGRGRSIALTANYLKVGLTLPAGSSPPAAGRALRLRLDAPADGLDAEAHIIETVN